MRNGRNDYVSISVYFAFEANISITRLVDKKQGCREHGNGDPQ